MKKRLLFINQHYYPDYAATGQQLTDLAEHLAYEGFDVTVLCSRGVYLSGPGIAPKFEVRNGVRIHRVGATSFGRTTHFGRLTDYASFFTGALLRMLFDERYDCVVMLTTPPLLCISGAVLQKLRGQRYGIWSMDLYPDAAEAAGMFRRKAWLAKLLHVLNNAGHRRADFVVDLGPVMKARLQSKGVVADRLHTIPVWSKRDEIEPISKVDNPLAVQFGLKDRFVVMYSGNAGIAHRFEEVLQVMQMLSNHPVIYFLFVGSGSRKREILSFVEAHGIYNFRYLNYFNREDLKYSLALGDVHLLTLRREMAGIAAPSKLYGIMAAARPVVMVGPAASEPGQTILEENIGRVIEPAPENPVAVRQLSDTLLHLYEQSTLCHEMGRRGREAFLRSYEQEVACRAWASLLAEVGDVNSGQPWSSKRG